MAQIPLLLVRPVSKLLLSLCLCLGLLAGGQSLHAQTRLNLPQLDRVVTLTESNRQALEGELYMSGIVPGSLSAGAQKHLLEALPEDLQAGCSSMVSSWGELARGSGRWSVRPLFFTTQAGAPTFLVAFRCESSHPDYKDFFDDRLALLSAAPGAVSLRFVPLDKDCTNCSELYHISLSQHFLVEGASVVAFAVGVSSHNPCCDGPESFQEQRVLLVRFPDGEPLLTLPKSGEHSSHDDAAGDVVTRCSSEIDYQRDAAQNVTGLAATTHCAENDKPQPPRQAQYHWNPQTRRFDPVPLAQK